MIEAYIAAFDGHDAVPSNMGVVLEVGVCPCMQTGAIVSRHPDAHVESIMFFDPEVKQAPCEYKIDTKQPFCGKNGLDSKVLMHSTDVMPTGTQFNTVLSLHVGSRPILNEYAWFQELFNVVKPGGILVLADYIVEGTRKQFDKYMSLHFDLEVLYEHEYDTGIPLPGLEGENQRLVSHWVLKKKHCYKTGNDWSKCAGQGLLYPPSLPGDLLARPIMCLDEPYCWKQLNWRHANPPKWRCSSDRNLRVYDVSIHDGVMAEPATLIERSLNVHSETFHQVFLCNHKNASRATLNYQYNFSLCPNNYVGETWKQDYDVAAEANQKAYANDTHFKMVDAIIAGFPGSEFERWRLTNKSLILNTWHRVNNPIMMMEAVSVEGCSHAASQTIFEDLKLLAVDVNHRHVIGASTLYDAEYIRHYTGLSPILLPATLLDAVGGLSWTPSKSIFLWNGNAMPEIYETFKESGVEFKLGPQFTYTMTQYAGVVVVPYSITNARSVEQYAMKIPMFVPSIQFAKNLGGTVFHDRTVAWEPYCPLFTSNDHPTSHKDSPYEFDPNKRIEMDGVEAEQDVLFWIAFADIYHWPCLTYFDSWEHLLYLLQTADLQIMSECMGQANKWRHFESLQNWCWALNHVQK